MLSLLVPGVGMGGGAAAGLLRFRKRAGLSLRTYRALARQYKHEASLIMTVLANLEWYRGEDVTVEFVMVPLADITGWAITFKASATEGGLAEVTKAATITAASQGKFTVAIVRTDTVNLSPGKKYWEVRRTDSGFNTVLAAGEWDLKRERAN